MKNSGWICKELLESYVNRPSVRTRTTYGNGSHVEERQHERHVAKRAVKSDVEPIDRRKRT